MLPEAPERIICLFARDICCLLYTSIAQALIGMPEVIILDEPTVGLDPKQIIEIRQLIKRLGKKHTVILSSHILSEISEVCDYIYIISRGCLVAAGSEKELVDQMAGKNVLEMEIKGNKDAVTAMMGTCLLYTSRCV